MTTTDDHVGREARGRSRGLRAPAAIVAAAAMAFCGVGAAEPAALAGQATPAPPSEEPAVYSIGPGDVLEVFVWREAELTRNVTVRPDGAITMPLLGDVAAAGRSPSELASDLQERLRRFVETPRVSVGIAEPGSRQFYVVGRVARSGAFPMPTSLSFVQGLALAGGLQEYAKADQILIIRRSAGKTVAIRVDYDNLANGSALNQNRELLPGDTIVVP